MKTRILNIQSFVIVLTLLVCFCLGTDVGRADEPCEGISNDDPWISNPLYRSYIDPNDPNAQDFFEVWQGRTQRYVGIDANNLDLCPPFVQETYAVYEAFFDPCHITILNLGHFSMELNEGVQRVVLPDSIWVDLCSDMNGLLCTKRFCFLSINEFHPRVSFPGKDILFLGDYERDIIMEFLGTECATVGLTQHRLPEMEREARYQFIQKFIRVFPGHWGGWILSTQPQVSEIVFNRDYSEALIFYRVVYEHGKAFYKKVDGEWMYVSSEIWGIE
jgi:hypothetical protein